MCTHLHVDHVGWNTRLENGRWVPTFPNARYVFGKTEFDYWTEQNAKAAVPPFADSVLPVVEANKAEIVRDDFAIGDHVRILPTPGHTPGHVAFTFGRGKDDAVFCGDLMHSPLQTRYPELSAKFDVDPGAGRGDAAQFPGALLRHRYAVLHGAFPLALVGKIRRRATDLLRGGLARFPRPACGDLRRKAAEGASATLQGSRQPHHLPRSGRGRHLNRTDSACG